MIRALGFALALALTACAAAHGGGTPVELRDLANASDAREVNPNATDAARSADARGAVRADVHSDSGTTLDAVTISDAASARSDLAESDGGNPKVSVEIWLGELWSTSSWTLCDPSASQQPSQVSATGYFDRTELELELDPSGELHGKIKFGEGETNFAADSKFPSKAAPRRPSYACAGSNSAAESLGPPERSLRSRYLRSRANATTFRLGGS